MESATQFIKIRGEEIGLLFTPYLFAIAKKMGCEITFSEKDLISVRNAYIKVFYFAAHNYVEIYNFDHPKNKLKAKHTLMDFETWGMECNDEFNRMIEVFIQVTTKKTIAENAKEIQEKKEQEAKSLKKKKNLFYRLIGKR